MPSTSVTIAGTGMLERSLTFLCLWVRELTLFLKCCGRGCKANTARLKHHAYTQHGHNLYFCHFDVRRNLAFQKDFLDQRNDKKV